MRSTRLFPLLSKTDRRQSAHKGASSKVASARVAQSSQNIGGLATGVMVPLIGKAIKKLSGLISFF
jgi:hypothetical protein